MKTLALRQVKLLAPAALATIALGVIMTFVAGAFGSMTRISLSPIEIGATLMLYVAPWLLGIAAVAPDGESGGLAFLGALPLGKKRHLALRVAVAAAWVVVVVAPFLVIAQITSVNGALALPEGAILSPALFAAAVAAGAITRQSLGAFLATPLLIVVPITAYGSFLSAVDAPGEHYLPMYPGLLTALAIAGFVAFADPGRMLARRVVRVVGVLGGGVALGCGVTTVCWAAAVASPERWIDVEARNGVVVVHDDLVPDWPGEKRTFRTVLVARDEVAAVNDASAAIAAGWRREGRHHVVSASLDGRRALLRGLVDQFEVVDVRSRKVERAVVVSPFRERPARAVGPRVDADNAAVPCGWLDDAAWMVRADRRVERLDDGRTLFEVPGWARPAAWGGSRLVYGDGERFELVDLRDGQTTPLPTSGLPGLSFDGDALALVELRDGAAPVLHLRQLDGPGAASLVLEDLDEASSASVMFSPGGRRALVEWRTSAYDADGLHPIFAARAVDLVSGEVRPSLLPHPYVTAWSRDGATVVDGHVWVDLAEPTLQARLLGPGRHDGRCVSWFEDEGTVVHAVLPAGRVERFALTR